MAAVDARRQKERRQKLILAVGGALLVLLLIIQGPKLLGRGGGSDAAPATTTTVASGSAAQPVLTALLDTDPLPPAGEGQLVSFQTFSTKDPFVQQVGAEDPGASGGSVAGSEAATPAPTRPATSVVPGSLSPSAPAPAESPGGPRPGDEAQPPAGAPIAPGPGTPVEPPLPAEPPSPTAVVLSINGIRETLRSGSLFPKEAPVFRLVSLSAEGARIGVAGGSFTTGDPTTLVRRGRLLVLENTATGDRYEIRIVSLL